VIRLLTGFLPMPPSLDSGYGQDTRGRSLKRDGTPKKAVTYLKPHVKRWKQDAYTALTASAQQDVQAIQQARECETLTLYVSLSHSFHDVKLHWADIDNRLKFTFDTVLKEYLQIDDRFVFGMHISKSQAPFDEEESLYIALYRKITLDDELAPIMSIADTRPSFLKRRTPTPKRKVS